MSSSTSFCEPLLARINLYRALTIVERASLIDESRFTCFTSAATREFKIDPESQITADERRIVESKTLNAKEVLRRLVIEPIATYFDFLLCTQRHERLKLFQDVQDHVQFWRAVFVRAR